MSPELLGRALADNRIYSAVSELPLKRIRSLEEAEAVQEEAVTAFSSWQRGYAMTATSEPLRRLVGWHEPLFAPLVEHGLLADGSRYRLPHGVLGAGCEIAFTIGRPLPGPDENVTIESVADAIASCHPGIGILARRVPGSVPLNDWTATADFALQAVHVQGPNVERWRDLDLESIEVRARINGQVMARGCGGDVMGHPLMAIVWLARRLQRRGRVIEAGDIVSTGSCTILVQVLPGQTFQAELGDRGTVTTLLT